MKLKLVIMGLIGMLITLTTGCIGSSNPYYGVKPYDYPPAIWLSESPNIWFVVNSPEEDERYFEPHGMLKIGELEIQFVIEFPVGSGMAIFHIKEDDSYSPIFRGRCTFSPDQLVITEITEIIDIYHGEVQEIIFNRITKDK